MALRLMSIALRKQALSIGLRAGHTSTINHAERIGKREIVGYGINGQPVYFDRLDYPMPAIRFKEETAEVMALREKEKGDWRKLSMHEKKALYRTSFCSTFAEMKAPTGDWKFCMSAVFVASSLALMISIYLNVFVYDERPVSFDEANKKAQLKRMLDLEVNPVHGLSSKWDYENKRWK